MPFLSDEQYVYQIIGSSPFNPLFTRRYQFQNTGDFANISRLVVRVPLSIPNAVEPDPGSIGTPRRIADTALGDYYPFKFPSNTFAYQQNLYRQVRTPFPATGTPATFADFLSTDIYLGERDFFMWYLQVALDTITQNNRLRNGSGLTFAQYNNLKYLTDLANAGFVSGAALPNLDLT